MTAVQSPRPLKNLLVTGGAGFIGSSFIRAGLARTGFTGRIVNLDALTYAGNLDNLAGHVDADRYTFVRGDICDAALVARVLADHAIDAVVHFAAESHVDRSILGPRAFVMTNVVGTFTLLEAARKQGGVHFHHVSTDEVYGSLGATGHFYEDTAYDPRSPYSASKASSDHLVRAYHHTYKLPVTVSNCSNNYGPYQFPEKLIPLMITNALHGKPLPVYGDGQNVRDWLYVDDHAEALWRILEHGEDGSTYNVGGENEWKNLDLVHLLTETLAEATGRPVDDFKRLITFVKDRPGHDQRYAINCDKIGKDLGWRPARDFQQGLRETVRWMLDNEPWLERVRSGAYQQWLDDNYAKR